MQFPIIPCDLCGSQEGLQRNAMKAMLEDIERRMPGRKETMIRALANVRPSHLLDSKLFDFARWSRQLQPIRLAAPWAGSCCGGTAFPFRRSAP